MDALVAGVQAQPPWHRFCLAGAVDAHHDRARWSWVLVGFNGDPPVAASVDVAVLAPDGRLREVAGSSKAPAAAA